MWPPLLLLFLVSMTIASKESKLKEDHSGGPWKGDSLSESSMRFAISLYKLVSSKTAQAPPNFFMSPISIYTNLAMMALGARSLTREQILEAMCLSDSQSTKVLKENFRTFLANLRTQEEKAEFVISNWFFPETSITVLPKYKQDVANYYNASIQSIDYKDPKKAEEEINELVSGQTDGKMEDVVSGLDDQTQMVVLDYASFTAKWDSPFSRRDTRRGHFKVNQQKTAEVPMMHRLGQYRICQDHDFLFVEIPFTKQIALLLLMPRNDVLTEAEHKISARLIRYYIAKAKTSMLDLYIPTISLEQEVNVEFGLLHMGITQVFSHTADFSRISNDTVLRVSRIYHKTLVKIDEDRTESSGAEGVQAVTLCKDSAVHIDQPFFALVYNKEVDTVLLIGRVMDPSV
ncbi:serine protease inhibitor A6-like [Dendropsophus ebraccatus]|uniref:serine protease inhibitor A6-like n=1 Tax=Dendropsophus ebraccatus TaxID=150705 RepID=UPI003831F5FB